jgi:hypothetical protein
VGGGGGGDLISELAKKVVVEDKKTIDRIIETTADKLDDVREGLEEIAAVVGGGSRGGADDADVAEVAREVRHDMQQVKHAAKDMEREVKKDAKDFTKDAARIMDEVLRRSDTEEVRPLMLKAYNTVIKTHNDTIARLEESKKQFTGVPGTAAILKSIADTIDLERAKMEEFQRKAGRKMLTNAGALRFSLADGTLKYISESSISTFYVSTVILPMYYMYQYSIPKIQEIAETIMHPGAMIDGELIHPFSPGIGFMDLVAMWSLFSYVSTVYNSFQVKKIREGGSRTPSTRRKRRHRVTFAHV